MDARETAGDALAVPALAVMVDPELCALLLATDDEFLKLKTWIESREFFVTPFVDRGSFARLMESLSELWPVTANLRESDPEWEEMKVEAGLPAKGCEICGAPDAELVRVLAAGAIHGRSIAWHRAWAHPINSVCLCFRHRSDLTNGRNSGESRALMAMRRKVNSLVRQRVLAEVNRIGVASRKARAAWKHLEQATHHELRKLEVDFAGKKRP